ncbi:uncharacterized protein LOC135398294 [Ornithodoros turicata]|uniref:uncharacterized protein LOC135398294 n=1 Tax=Ornithodoros turicata TaxID=34597 RepID=UPI00313943C5
MCTVGQQFNKPDPYECVGCDYVIFDPILPTAAGLIGSEDQHAWNVFKSMTWIQQPKPEFGIAFPGRYTTELPGHLSGNAMNELKQLFAKGYRSFGVLNCHGTVSFLSGTTGAKLGELFNKIFNAMTAAQRDAGLKTFFVGLQLSAGSSSQRAALIQYAQAISHLNLLILQTHITPLPPLTASDCFIYPSFTWSQQLIKDNYYSSLERACTMLDQAESTTLAFAFSYSMAVNIYGISSSPSSSNTRYKDPCLSGAVTSMDDFCLLLDLELLQLPQECQLCAHRGYVKGKRLVYSYTAFENILYSFERVRWRVPGRLGVLLADIQFDGGEHCSRTPVWKRGVFMRYTLDRMRNTTAMRPEYCGIVTPQFHQ